MQKKVAIGYFIFFLIALIFFSLCWYNFFKDEGPSDFNGLFLFMLIVATIYYFAFMTWSYYLIYKEYDDVKIINIQFVFIFIFGIITFLFLMAKLYFYY